jgi:hypothetical protein
MNRIDALRRRLAVCVCLLQYPRFQAISTIKGTSNTILDAHASGIRRVPVNWFGKKYVKLGDPPSRRDASVVTRSPGVIRPISNRRDDACTISYRTGPNYRVISALWDGGGVRAG